MNRNTFLTVLEDMKSDVKVSADMGWGADFVFHQGAPHIECVFI